MCGIFRSFGPFGRGLASSPGAADTLSMLDFVTEELAGNRDWRRVLEAYQRPHVPRKAEEVTDEQWVPRVTGLEGVESAELSRLHGTLIALGFLKFELSGKAGMQYQLTPLGRHTLDQGLDGEQSSDDQEFVPAEETSD
jgi:hypothetical protein